MLISAPTTTKEFLLFNELSNRGKYLIPKDKIWTAKELELLLNLKTYNCSEVKVQINTDGDWLLDMYNVFVRSNFDNVEKIKNSGVQFDVLKRYDLTRRHYFIDPEFLYLLDIAGDGVDLC